MNLLRWAELELSEVERFKYVRDLQRGSGMESFLWESMQHIDRQARSRAARLIWC